MSRSAPALDVTRTTLAFNTIEDRISLACELATGEIELLWLTAPLACRLIPHLLALTAPVPDVHSQRTSQEAAGYEVDLAADRRGEKAKGASVAAQHTAEAGAPVFADEDSASWVVAEIDISHGPMLVRLCFRGVGDRMSNSFTLEHTQLARWVDGLRHCYAQSGWPMDCWEKAPSTQSESATTWNAALH
ncbi:MAG: hypothetical protein P8L39_11820 [Halioglobus sp.]|nr:hypothetical protein [Halioglobus sp.]